jgi:hypothetical protein
MVWADYAMGRRLRGDGVKTLVMPEGEDELGEDFEVMLPIGLIVE